MFEVELQGEGGGGGLGQEHLGGEVEVEGAAICVDESQALRKRTGGLRSACLRQLAELQGFSRSVGVSEAAAPVAVVAAYRVPDNK